MLHFFLKAVDWLTYALLFPVYWFLEGGEISFFVFKQLIDLIWEELDVLHHVPKMFRVNGYVGIVSLGEAVWG